AVEPTIALCHSADLVTIFRRNRDTLSVFACTCFNILDKILEREGSMYTVEVCRQEQYFAGTLGHIKNWLDLHGVEAKTSFSRRAFIEKTCHIFGMLTSPIVPLYAAPIADLGSGDFVSAKCIDGIHDVLIPADIAAQLAAAAARLR